MNRVDQMNVVEGRVLELMSKFEDVYGKHCKYNADVPSEIKFSKRGSTAGVSSFDYFAGYGTLNFNPIIITSLNFFFPLFPFSAFTFRKFKKF